MNQTPEACGSPALKPHPPATGLLSDVGHAEDSAKAVLTLDIFASGPRNLHSTTPDSGAFVSGSCPYTGRQDVYVLCMYRYSAATGRGGGAEVPPPRVCIYIFPPCPGSLLRERRRITPGMQSRRQGFMRRPHCTTNTALQSNNLELCVAVCIVTTPATARKGSRGIPTDVHLLPLLACRPGGTGSPSARPHRSCLGISTPRSSHVHLLRTILAMCVCVSAVSITRRRLSAAQSSQTARLDAV